MGSAALQFAFVQEKQKYSTITYLWGKINIRTA